MRKVLGASRSLKEERCEEDTVSDASTCDEDSKEQELEEWIAWMKRSTQTVETTCRKIGMEDWVTQQQKRKWRLAGHTARRDDERWSTKVLNWTPVGKRDRRRPNKRWADDLNDFFKKNFEGSVGFWQVVAQNRDEWQKLEDDFCETLSSSKKV